MIDFNEILKPETELEKRIISDPTFIKGALYGKERPGHPEGKVVYHIKDVLKNIDEHYEDDEQRTKLRLIALFHDTCKFQVDYDQRRVGENHHGYLARKFAEKYITDKDILMIIEHHDDAYNIWKRSNKRNEWEKGERDLLRLVDKMNDPDLYSTFYLCDNSTGTKKNDDYDWFLEISGL